MIREIERMTENCINNMNNKKFESVAELISEISRYFVDVEYETSVSAIRINGKNGESVGTVSFSRDRFDQVSVINTLIDLNAFEEHSESDMSSKVIEVDFLDLEVDSSEMIDEVIEVDFCLDFEETFEESEKKIEDAKIGDQK